MRVAALALVLMATPAAAEPDYVGQFQRWLYPPKASPTVPAPVPAPQSKAKSEAEPPPILESPRVRPRSVERDRPKVRKVSKVTIIERPETAKPRLKEGPPPGDVCAKIGWGLTVASRPRVISEGMKRGFPKSEVEKTIRDCGY